MTVSEVQQQALALSEKERGILAALLIETLPPSAMEISDEEALQRDAELEAGRVDEIPHEEFVRDIERERGK